MPASEVEEVLALTIVFVVHVVGGILLVWGILDDEDRRHWRRRRGGEGPDDPPRDRSPSPSGTRAELPLPGAATSRVRLREDARVGGAYPRPARRPAHPPAPGPVPTRRE